jgi:predicted amidohydrolase
MEPHYAVAVAQTCAFPGDIAANLGEHLRLIELAAERGAEAVLFPELSLTGYEPKLADRVAMLPGDARLAPLIELSAKRGITVVAGAPVRIGAALHIAAFVIEPSAAVSLYTKQHLGAFGESARVDGDLPPAEPSIFQPGTLDPEVRLGDGFGALAICADTGRASHAARAAERGATAYLASMFVIPSEFEGDRVRLSRYAADHALLVAFANYGAPTGGLAAAGRSSIWAPGGNLLVQLPASGSGVAVVSHGADGWRAETALAHHT